MISLLVMFVAKWGVIPSNFVNSQIAMVSLMMLVVLLSKKIMLESKIFQWFGTYVFEIYILQRLSMNFGMYMHWNEYNIYLYFVFCLATTLLFAILFRILTKKIDSMCGFL